MAARRKQKQASNSYNLGNRVEITIEIQAEDDSAFWMNLLHSQVQVKYFLVQKEVTLILPVQTGLLFFKRVLKALIFLIHRLKSNGSKLGHL